MTKYLLLSGVDTSKLGSAHYLFDRHALDSNVISIPTQQISKHASQVIATLKALELHRFPRTLEEIERSFELAEERKFIQKLVGWGYLDPVSSADAPKKKGGKKTEKTEKSKPSSPGTIFEKRILDQFFTRPLFFNLPPVVDDGEVDVGLVGVPFSSLPLSTGTTVAADFLRWLTARTAFWFDVHRSGFHSDVGVEGAPRDVLGRGVVAKDFGDLGTGVRRVRELFAAADEFVKRVVVEQRIKPLFIGGDHAVTFPIVHSLLESYPKLAVLHLDAHHDLFYSAGIEYSHASPMRGLLLYSELTRLYSFGLRTTFDPRTGPREAFEKDRTLEKRVRHYSLPALRRLTADAKRFRRELAPLRGRPCYLSIDLDVLSHTVLSGRTSTPAGQGLDWPELLEIVDMLFDSANVIGCDMVELNPYRTGASEGEEVTHLPALLALLMDRLSKSKIPKPARGRRGKRTKSPTRPTDAARTP
jgi:arginase family enzyme